MPEVPYGPDFAKRGGLVPAVVQDVRTGEVLMLAWVNDEAWKRTVSSGNATFWSTSRNELWEKGATSGDWLKVVEVRVDCDDDTVLYRVEPQPAYIPDEDAYFREPSDMRELGPDELGSLVEMGLPGDVVKRVMRFSAGGLEDE